MNAWSLFQRAGRTACAVLLCLSATLAAAQARFQFDATRSVLPKSAVPSHYALALDLDPARDRFGGRVEIRLRVREPVQRLVLHAHALQPLDAQLVRGSERRKLIVKADARSQTWRLARADGKRIGAGPYRLAIRYRGQVHRVGEGLYRADHRVNGKPATMLATQLEATKARTLFPAFDEPLFRAVFQLEVTAPADLQVLSNQPRIARRVAGRRAVHRFAPTPPMPSYLVAVAVGRFDRLDGRAGRVPLSIYTAPGKREQARFALDITGELLPYFNGYFGTPYALPKLDQLAVPGTRMGAMEDWGLISYVENTLLYDPARSGPGTQRRVFSVVAHEIAHQWFGNLVSVSSWDEIWLNEAFATWMASKAMEQLRPQWQSRLSGRRWTEEAMERDANRSTRAIRSGPVDEARVFQVFDSITYSKGGAVLSMLEQWLGEAAFQRGLAAYMAERRLKPATAGDLWHHLGRAVDKPAAAVAATWTDQPGFPLIDIASSCSDGRTVVTLRQQRFSSGGESGFAPPTWQVPVRLARGETLDTVLLDAPERRFDLPGCSDVPIVANAGGRGFYRVRYDDAQRASLLARFASLAPTDRVALLADSFALAQAGQQPLARHFDWLAQLPAVQDKARAPLFALVLQQIETLEQALEGLPAAATLRRAARSLLAPELRRIGWQPSADEDPEVTRLRGNLIQSLARLDDMEVVAAARERFDAALAPGGAVPGSVRAAVINAVGRHAEPNQTEALWRALRATEDQDERWQLITALAGTRDGANAQRLLDAALQDWLPPDLATWLPGIVSAQPQHAALAYRFALANWPPLAARAGSGVFGERARLLPDAAQGLVERADAERLRADQKRLAGAAGAVAAERVAARIELRAALREREAERLAVLGTWRPVP